MAYEYDVFLSYKREFAENWLTEIFLPRFRFYLEDHLGAPPKIFMDTSGGIRSGDDWELRLRYGLSRSKCLVGIWSPSYFQSRWCRFECEVMLERGKQLGYHTEEDPSGIVHGVVISDGRNFPEYAQRIQYFNSRKYMLDGGFYKDTPDYVEFQHELRTWVEDVVENIFEKVPPWSEDFTQIPDNTIEVKPVEHVNQPVMG